MGRVARGTVIETKGKKDTTFAIRFTVAGRKHYQTVGSRRLGCDRGQAEAELRHVLADVERGRWQPPAVEQLVAPREVPSFHRFATDWLASQVTEGGRRGKGLTEAGKADLEWRLSNHLLKTFASMRLDQISIEQVDAFRRAKVREGLSPRSVNKLLSTLSAILELACEYGHVQRNVAHGKRRRIKAEPTQRSYINRADHLAALLAGASKVDADARLRPGQRRALLAALAFAGLRLGEALSLIWGDVGLAAGAIRVREGKTATATRTVYMLPVLRDELSAYKASLKPAPQDVVFATTTGRPLGASNVRRRILAPAVEQANKQLAKAKVEPLPDGLTPQSLRRTFASLLFAVGESPVYVKGQLGHTDATLTLNYYAREMDRRDGEPERLKALVQGGIETQKDRNEGKTTAVPVPAGNGVGRKVAA